MNLKQVLSAVLPKVKPDLDYVKFLKSNSKEVITLLKKHGLDARIGGSLAKETLVKTSGKSDVDIFVIFKNEKDMVKLPKAIDKLKFKGNVKLLHGSRDYFQLENERGVFEIIPVLENKKGEAVKNVTDFSLKHVKYVNSKIKQRKSIADEIIISKAFFKAQGLYGAESYVRGFSGYSLEVLTIYFGSFVNLLKGIQKGKVIDPENYFRNDDEVKRELNESKITGPLVVVDPTYKYRNVCAGLGSETFEKALIISRNFILNPSVEYFDKKEFDLNVLRDFANKKNYRLLQVDLSTDRQEGDIAGTKMKKLLDFIIVQLENKKQKVLKKEFIYENSGQSSKGYIVLEENKIIDIKGPSKKLVEAVKGFKKARKDIFLKGGFYYAKEHVSLNSLFDKILVLSKDMGASAKIKII